MDQNKEGQSGSSGFIMPAFIIAVPEVHPINSDAVINDGVAHGIAERNIAKTRVRKRVSLVSPWAVGLAGFAGRLPTEVEPGED
jgi:hypothetical protein